MTDKEPIYCPFCGNEEPLVKGGGYSWGVYCDLCNATIKGYKTRETAVNQWNRRFDPFK